MKLPTFHRQRGFTLVELLVVIAIIAVLAAAGFAAGNFAVQRAKKVKCLATATALEGAVNNFFTEYGYMPVDDAADTTVETDVDANLITVLSGLETVATPKNTRAIKFLQVQQGKANTNGMMYSADGKSVTGLYDPWGGGYHVMLDCDYDERITPAPAGGGGASLNGKRVAVWSDGADGVKGGGTAADDVKTW